MPLNKETVFIAINQSIYTSLSLIFYQVTLYNSVNQSPWKYILNSKTYTVTIYIFDSFCYLSIYLILLLSIWIGRSPAIYQILFFINLSRYIHVHIHIYTHTDTEIYRGRVHVRVSKRRMKHLKNGQDTLMEYGQMTIFFK